MSEQTSKKDTLKARKQFIDLQVAMSILKERNNRYLIERYYKKQRHFRENLRIYIM